MKVTFNSHVDNDCLLVTLKPADTPEYETIDNITVIKDGDEIVGLNIFDARNTLGIDALDTIESNTTTVEVINRVLEEKGISKIAPDVSHKFVIGKVEEIEAHKDADKLSVCQVNVGDARLQIVCGAPNVDKDQKVVVARVGAFMPNGLYIKPSELRGVYSEGMICSRSELGMTDDGVKGIYVLEDGEVGEEFYF